MKNPEKYECGSLQVKISECGRCYTPARERTSKWEISVISSFVQESPAQNGRVGRYAYLLQYVCFCMFNNSRKSVLVICPQGQ